MPTKESHAVQDRLSQPEVTVLLPVHNGVPYIEKSLRSMMNQTLRNIEIIVVDDASTDGTPSVLARLAAEDSRVRIVTLTHNSRLVGALNAGLELARAPYIARMDADDVSYPSRLETQKRYMDDNPAVILCGTSCRYIDAQGQFLKVAHRPRDAVMCRWMMRFRQPVIHPSFMFRRLLPDGTAIRYKPIYPVEDLEFVSRIMKHGMIVSLPDVLLDYRQHMTSTTSKYWKIQQEKGYDILWSHVLEDLPPNVVRTTDAFFAAFLRLTATDQAAFFRGMREMLVYDSRTHPAHARWFRRQAAQLAYEALRRTRLHPARTIWAFLRYGTDFVPDLVLRLMEIRNLLPSSLRSDINLR